MKPIDDTQFMAGVTWWRTRTTWPRDFHNQDYAVMTTENPYDRFDAAWWVRVERRLARWKAFRPVAKEVVAANVAANAADLAAAWKVSCKPYRDTDIADPAVIWEALRGFTDVVFRLKPTNSPVFPSKLCHFLLPKVFPVIDGLALAARQSSYGAYFDYVKNTWAATPMSTRDHLTAEITRLVGESGRPLDPAFPIVTKIVELALIGRSHPIANDH